MYPIAQVREPYTAVGYLAQRVPLVRLLRLEHPDADPQQRRGSKAAGKRRVASDSGVLHTAALQHRGKGGGSGDEKGNLVTSGQGVTTLEMESEPEVWTAWDICDGRYNDGSL